MNNNLKRTIRIEYVCLDASKLLFWRRNRDFARHEFNKLHRGEMLVKCLEQHRSLGTII